MKKKLSPLVIVLTVMLLTESALVALLILPFI